MSNECTAGSNAPAARNVAVACLLALSVAGCFEDTARTSRSSVQNIAPSISGSPAPSGKINVAYSFQPAANDPDGDALTFAIINKPAWAAFDAKSGRLSGTPSSSSTGVFADIRISVSDGKASTSLPAFSINVAGTDLGSATLYWQPPTSNTDGSPLTNLAGYVIRYGTGAGNLSTEVRVGNPGLTTYMVTDLAPATWYFQVSAYNSDGVESAPSATASKTIS